MWKMGWLSICGGTLLIAQTNPINSVCSLYDVMGKRIAQHDGQPVNNQLPTTLWVPGDLILDRHFFPDTILIRTGTGFELVYTTVNQGDNIPRVGDNGSTEPWFDTGVILKP